ncbi:dihydrofolate reductase [Candidatus Cetobacterium colombiensis]|uniref:Dihydrofolate reductase n=1 Tax=Candidatus Cetobacterium colombiensis TaxID=3073100 RepID=A0ABU4W9K1_9FUSO|nr:dihydrofolate reductase [Candidatus Cetobacterium colombiensis]MDX8336210.1 dihydrofolate reductase [Candidatus Cetobacterium colombiensis]
MLSLIVAMDENNIIGCNNKMPWNIPEDLSLFKKITTNSIVIMGRKTFESIGKPLPNRINFVLSRDKNFFHKDIKIFNCPNNALETALSLKSSYNKEIFIIGGKTIYEYFLPFINELHLSFIKGKYFGDTFFPPLNLNDFSIVNKLEFKEFTYVHYIKNTCNL